MLPATTRRLALCALAAAGVGILATKGLIERRLGPIEAPSSLRRQRAEVHARSIRHLQLGFGTSLADLLWIRFLQAHSHEPIGHGDVSWEFVQLDTITALDPRFTRAYEYGSILLSILREDRLGARLMLEKWVKRLPNRWRPTYLLGFHLYSELGQYAEASKYILRAAALPGAPYWLSALGVRLLSESGALRQALQLTADLYAATGDERTQERLIRRARSLNFAIQKSSWEELAHRFTDSKRRAPTSLSELEIAGTWREPSSALDGEGLPDAIKLVLQERFLFRWDNARKAVVSVRTEKEMGLDPVGIFQRPGGEHGS